MVELADITSIKQFCSYCRRVSKTEICKQCKKELKKQQKANVKAKKMDPKNKTYPELTSDNLLACLTDRDLGEGVPLDIILKTFPNQAEEEMYDKLFELAYEGRLYQPRPDYYKAMD